MNKYILLVMTFLGFFASCQAFAGTLITSPITVGGSTVGQSFIPSNHVSIWVDIDAANGYVAYSWHSNGNRKFATGNGSSKMYWQDGTNIAHKTLAEHISGNRVWVAPWKAL